MSTLPLFQHGGRPVEYLSVSQFTSQVKGLLETEFPEVRVAGEISNLGRPSSGHLYFNLKDSTAILRAVIWKSTASRLVFDLDNGMRVRLIGGLTVYSPRGEYQVVVRSIEPDGVGALELALRQLCDRLRAEGLFDADRKRPLPPYPGVIVVIASPTGAAVRDFLQVVGRRWPSAQILVAPARVQGEGATADLVQALALANRVAGADLVVLTRGGGSLEDLWPFNQEALARAIVGSRLPVVSAVGHETDVTVADLAADLRAYTPTDAANRCVPDAQEQSRLVSQKLARLAHSTAALMREAGYRLDRQQNRLRLAAGEQLGAASQQVERLSERLPRSLQTRLSDAHRRLAADQERLQRAWSDATIARASRLAQGAGRLEALSPLAVLTRGYSLTQRLDDGTIVREAARLANGDRLLTRLASGWVVSQVIEASSDRDPPPAPG